MVPTNPFMAGACVLGSVVAAQTAYLQVFLMPRVLHSVLSPQLFVTCVSLSAPPRDLRESEIHATALNFRAKRGFLVWLTCTGA